MGEKAKRFAAAAKEKKLADAIPIIAGLAKGEIIIPEKFLEDRVKKALADVEGVSDVTLTCGEGVMTLTATVQKAYAKYTVTADAVLERVCIDENEQVVVLRVLDDSLDVAAQNILAKAFRGVAQGFIEGIVKDAAKADDVAMSTDGLVVVQWPCIVLDLSSTTQSLHPLGSHLVEKALLTRLRIQQGTVEEKRVTLLGSWGRRDDARTIEL